MLNGEAATGLKPRIYCRQDEHAVHLQNRFLYENTYDMNNFHGYSMKKFGTYDTLIIIFQSKVYDGVGNSKFDPKTTYYIYI